MKRQFRTALYSSVALAAFAASVPAIAQEITSSIRGTVVDAAGNALSGVTVTVTHVNSGSRSTFVTNSSGAFLARGLRPGGPYTVEVAASGNYQGQKFEDLFLNVSEPLPLTIPLVGANASVEEIEVVASRIQSIREGGASAYGADRISELPSINRDFKDAIRQNPFVTLDRANSGALSIGGANNKFNSITVDGLQQDDTFGLNASGVPTQRSPISIDTIEQVSVAPAPFGVEFGGFTGGTLNVVTKSGTNEFHGTASFSYRDGSLAGDTSKEDPIDLGTFENKFYSATLGGPIVKDKLFFFAGYEKFNGTTPNLFGAEDSNATNKVVGVTNEDLQRIDQIASSVYGIDTLGTDASSIKEADEKIFAKIDWNINDSHRAFFSYQRTDGNKLIIEDTRTSGQYGFLSHWYNRSETLDAYNFQLFSDWTDSFSTELKVGYTDQKTGQNSLSEPGLGEIRIRTDGGSTVYIGTDDSRQSNDLSNKTWNIKAKADYVSGDHTITGGYELASVEVFNLFIQRSLGVWSFNSIEDFEDQRLNSLQYQNAVTNNDVDGAANFTIGKHTLYLQDRWDANENLTLTGGVRVDFYQQNQAPNLNDNFVDRNGFANTGTLDGKKLIQPRFAFNYDFDDKTIVRGGVGRFGGGDPNVWISNAFSQDGVTISTYNLSRRAGNSDAELAILNNPALNSIPALAQAALTAGNGDVNATDPDFKVPSVWKFNLAVEHYFDFGALGDDWHWAFEAIWTRTDQAANWVELRRTQVGTAIDGSPIYDVNSGSDILLTNTSKGKQDVYAVSFDKSWDNGLTLVGSYAYTNAEVVNEGTSSTAGSNYNFPAALDRNNRLPGTSPFEIKHQAKLGLTYQKAFWGDNNTTISLFYNGRSGKPYSLTLGRDSRNQSLPFGGNGGIDSGASHLLYVPAVGEVEIDGGTGWTPQADTKVVFATADDRDNFNTLVRNLGLTRGQSVDVQGQRGPWINELDLHIAQEVNVGFGKVELFADMENVLNFINSDWGRYDYASFAQINVANVDTLLDGRFRYRAVQSDPALTTDVTRSVWTLQIGAKYKF